MPLGPKTFVVDTNVFVDCPDILSKVKDPDSAVVPTTVLEELGKLKINMKVNKARLTSAIKNINASFSSHLIQLAETDVSVLPDGFDAKNPDTLIISSALKLKADGRLPVLLTSDVILQGKAIALSVAAISLRDFNRR